MDDLLIFVEVAQGQDNLNEDVPDALLREPFPFLLQRVEVFVEWSTLYQLHDDVQVVHLRRKTNTRWKLKFDLVSLAKYSFIKLFQLRICICLAKERAGHQPYWCEWDGILAGNSHLLSKKLMCLADLLANLLCENIGTFLWYFGVGSKEIVFF